MIRKIARLTRTSPAELRFRLHEKAQALTERARFAAGGPSWRGPVLSGTTAGSAHLAAAALAVRDKNRSAAGAAWAAHLTERTPRFALHANDRPRIVSRIQEHFPSAPDDAARRAHLVIDGRYDLLGYRGLRFQSDRDALVDWQFDPVSSRRPPPGFWSRVPYLDPRIGDHKVIWELNRHQHWLTLGRADWLSPSAEYSQRFQAELGSWLQQNRPYDGVNWSSMLELAFRSLSWLWALHFFAEPEAPDSSWILDLLGALQMQLDHLSKHLSWYFSPNTHLLGEGLALYVAGRALPELRHAGRWEAQGREVLIKETRAQVHKDGGHAEQSLHYHLYALDFYLLALTVARRTKDPAEAVFAETAARMARFCRAMTDDSGRLPTIGDDDGGALFPICGRQPFDAGPTLSLAAVLLQDPSLSVRGLTEEVIWMTAGQTDLPVSDASPLPSLLFSDSGYLSLRAPHGHAIVDGGRHGFLNGGHAHADALSMTLSINNRPLLIDPGTSTYVMDPEVRDRFRSTAMHNTVVLDGRSQSRAAGPFHWATRTDATIIQAHLTPGFDYVEAQHTGFAPVVHSRAIMRAGDLWIVGDHLIGQGEANAHLHWHLDPAWRLHQRGTGAAFIGQSSQDCVVMASSAPDAQLLFGDPDGVGWYAPIYGAVFPSPTIRLTKKAVLPFSIVTVIAGPVAGEDATEMVVADDLGTNTARVSHMGRHYLAVWGGLPAQPDEPAVQRINRVSLEGSIFSTDAGAALLVLSKGGDPVELHLIGATHAAWSGSSPFRLDREVAEDLHLDAAALRQSRL